MKTRRFARTWHRVANALAIAVAVAVAIMATATGCRRILGLEEPSLAEPGQQDAAPVEPDAAPAPAIEGAPGAELTAGGGRVSGGRYRVDVQVGHPTDSAPVAGEGTTTRSAAPVEP